MIVLFSIFLVAGIYYTYDNIDLMYIDIYLAAVIVIDFLFMLFVLLSKYIGRKDLYRYDH